jgi:segregation and condensation protein A
VTVLYKLQTFEGPLDLLLHLIDKSEINIQDISISEITDQYLAYLDAMQEMELDVTSEFLVMAATLLAMKSRLLLPKPPAAEEPLISEEDAEGPDPREELIRKLIEYRKYKLAAARLRDMAWERSQVFTREAADLSAYQTAKPVNPLEGLQTEDLSRAFRKVMRRYAGRTRIAAIRRDEISVKDRISDIIYTFKNRSQNGKMLFSQLIGDRSDKQEVVVTFLAVLELMKKGWITCHQNRLFDEIVVTWTGKEGEDGLFDIEIGT